MRFRYIAIVFLFCAFLTMSSVHVTTAEPSELMFENTVSGPYLDKVRYQVISSEDQRILALQSDAIDIIDGPISFAYHSILELDPEIELSSILRNGYGHITINCAKNPLNYSVLRRAFAFAFDKTLVPNLVDGVDQMHDSIVPYVSSYCYEDEFDWHYYDNQSTLANQMLNEAGFAIDGGTGFRLTPFGDAFDIVIAYSPSFPPGGGIAQLAVDTLASLHIDASSNSDDFNTIIANVQNHGDYDMVFYGSNFYSDDVDWLANEYYSAYASVPYMNPTNFQNSTFDSYRNQLLYSSTYSEVYNAAREMQKILHHNVPELVVYEETQYSAYRTNRFEGHVIDKFKNVENEWTNLKVHQNLMDGGPFNGTFRISLGQEPDSFNPMITNSYYSKVILANMYDSLFRIGPDGERRLSLAESYFAENHDNNSEVPVGHLRFTFDIVQGATWTDGTPLTADDVAYTFSYLYESMAYGNPMGIPLVDLFSSTSPLPTRAVVEFSSESYWHISTFAELPIFQKTLLESLGYSGWNSWNPIFSPDPCPTSGPFNITNMQAGEYYELSYYPNYRNRVRGNGSDQPNVGGPSHFTAISGTIPNTISWNINDDNPLLYRLYNNGSLAEADYNTHSRVSININSHVTTYGLYNFTIQILDWEYQHAEHTVLVDFVPDTIDPVIEGPDDMNITAGDVGENIVWNVTDHNPSTYSILLNGAEEDTGSWNNGEPIVFNLSDLTVGDYNVTLIANDLMGHSNADTVLVSVHAPPGFVMDTMMLLGIAGVVGVIVVAVVVFKVKRAS